MRGSDPPPMSVCAYCDELRPVERRAHHGVLDKAFCSDRCWRSFLGAVSEKGPGAAHKGRRGLAELPESVGHAGHLGS